MKTLTIHHKICNAACLSHCDCGWRKTDLHEAAQWARDYRTRLVLASSSSYRADLLQRLNMPFMSLSPDIDETARNNESAEALATRLASEKAKAAAESLRATNPEAVSQLVDLLFIGSDQVASLDGQPIGQPGTVPKACKQLQRMQGQSVIFHTALCIHQPASGQSFSALDTTVARLRRLNELEIERYIAIDNPLDCAGSFKVEALGISLFESVASEDPTALIGLPLIALCRGLRSFGVAVP